MKNDLLKVAPKALQFLHAEKGMDFEKPFVYVEGNGKFTLKSLEKLANLDFATEYATACLLKLNLLEV